jgi:SHR-binding domain of vacuolar-sorting associated protein 13
VDGVRYYIPLELESGNTALIKPHLRQPISFEAVGSTQEIGMPKVGDKEVYLGISVTEGQGKVRHQVCSLSLLNKRC